MQVKITIETDDKQYGWGFECSDWGATDFDRARKSIGDIIINTIEAEYAIKKGDCK